MAINTKHYFLPFVNACVYKEARAGLGLVTSGNAQSFLFENRVKKKAVKTFRETKTVLTPIYRCLYFCDPVTLKNCFTAVSSLFLHVV